MSVQVKVAAMVSVMSTGTSCYTSLGVLVLCLRTTNKQQLELHTGSKKDTGMISVFLKPYR